MKKTITKVGNKLIEEKIEFDEIILKNAIHTVQDVVNECKCNPSQVMKTLLFIGQKGTPILTVLEGDKEVNKVQLESFVKQKVKMAKPNQVLKITRFPIGSVSPFLINPSPSIMLFADKSLLKINNIYLGSGEKMILISMTSLEFKKAFKGKYIKIS